MFLIDTHTHLYLPQFDADRDDAVKRALDSGVKYMLLPNIDTESIEPMLSMVRLYPKHVFPMLALHPTSVKSDYRDILNTLWPLTDTQSFCAVGETGMDLYWDTTYEKEQADAFIAHIHLAHKLSLPLVIHSRNSLPQLLDILGDSSLPRVKGVFHCYPGDAPTAVKIAAMGFKIGVGGTVTYKKSGVPEVVRAVGAEHIILETDAPYLPPVPHRGQRNESAYIPLIAAKIAESLNLSTEAVAEITTRNAITLFNLPEPNHI